MAALLNTGGKLLRSGRCPESNTNTDTVHGQMFTYTQAAPQSTTPALSHGLTTAFSDAHLAQLSAEDILLRLRLRRIASDAAVLARKN